MSIVLCSECACGCIPVDLPCLRRYTRIANLSFENHARLFDLTNAFIARQLLGEYCFNELCSAVKQAAAEASEAKEADKWQDYLSSTWKSIVQSHYFVRAYYLALLAQYDMSGDSVTQLTADGRVSHKRPIQEGGKENVFLREAQYMATVNGHNLNHAIVQARTWLVAPLYKAGSLNCYNYCGNASLLGCADGGGKFWHGI